MSLDVTATYKIVTPMYLGGADQKATVIRPSSFKGVLRYWWRAINWGKILETVSGDESKALTELHKEEARLFGSALKIVKNKEVGGQGVFLLHVISHGLQQSNLSIPGIGMKYLIGQGLSSRSHISPGKTFDVKLRFRPNSACNDQLKTDMRSVAEAMLVLGLIGGLGSRSRRGLGSIAIQKLIGIEGVEAPKDMESLKDSIKNICDKLSATELPPFTAFSKESRVDMSMIGNKLKPLPLLDSVGQEMFNYRSWKGKASEKNFRPDHDLIRDVILGKEERPGLPKRVVFGLPHNYFFSSLNKEKKKCSANIAPSTSGRTRRASPLFIHAHEFIDQSSAIVQCLLPSVFLAEKDQVDIEVPSLSRKKRDSIHYPVNHAVNWDVIHNYLNRFEERKKVLP